MSEVPVKKKHQSGSEKRKKRQEQQNKLNEQLKKTQNLFKLGFSCESKEHQLHDSLVRVSGSRPVPCEPFEQIGQDQETPKLVGAEESEAETEVIHQNVVHLERKAALEQSHSSDLYRHYTTFFGINSSVGNYAQTSRKGDERKQDSSLVLKRVSDTRWCARADATKALANGYNSFQKALQSIAGDETQTSQAIHEAKFDLLKSLLHFLISQRELFDDYETKANEKTDTQYSDENQRVRKRKRHHDDGAAEEVVFRGKEKLKVDTYLPVLDMLCTELSRRLEAYREINNLFGFLTDFSTKSDVEIRQACTKFKEHYFEDIEPEFIDEMVQYKYFILQLEDAGKKIMPAEKSYKLIIGNMAQSTFPNVMTAL
ncbi:hypothetical protein EVAR_89368_1 [Eumeta japonica]|uniref:Uncharacterized protein n=1 Tax=Eumeta variegata TaxID=151549 RepID=A0A4C1ZT88_EUMVA|nr:hypothetical protein EVAR_89368_1 [Eumeta japonica]